MCISKHVNLKMCSTTIILKERACLHHSWSLGTGNPLQDLIWFFIINCLLNPNRLDIAVLGTVVAGSNPHWRTETCFHLDPRMVFYHFEK